MGTVSRRDFIKTTSATAAGATALSFAPLSSAMGTGQLSRVVKLSDQDCFDFDNGTVDTARVQDLVDSVIMTLVEETDRATAYEKIFGDGLTDDSQIIIKYNNGKPALTREPVIDALINGLESMRGGFSASNITQVGDARRLGNESNTTFSLGSNDYTLRDIWDDCDYIINLPSCWALSSGCGVAMALKNMITAFSGGSISSMHSYFTNENAPALSVLNSQDVFKEKQKLVLLDAISLGATGGGSASDAACTIIASSDMVAVDVLGTELLNDTGRLSSSNYDDALEVCRLAALPDYGLGTNDTSNMEIITEPTSIRGGAASGSSRLAIRDVHIQKNPTHTVFSYSKKTGITATCTIYDIMGRKIWMHRSSDNSIVWPHKNIRGQKVSSGTYLYRFDAANVVAHGRIAVK